MASRAYQLLFSSTLGKEAKTTAVVRFLHERGGEGGGGSVFAWLLFAPSSALPSLGAFFFQVLHFYVIFPAYPTRSRLWIFRLLN